MGIQVRVGRPALLLGSGLLHIVSGLLKLALVEHRIYTWKQGDHAGHIVVAWDNTLVETTSQVV